MTLPGGFPISSANEPGNLQRRLVRKNCSLITFYFYVLLFAYPRALSSSN
jgi:hypothetical protein